MKIEIKFDEGRELTASRVKTFVVKSEDESDDMIQFGSEEMVEAPDFIKKQVQVRDENN
ncbi:MAG: hypothetical protein MUF15_20335 [Acidobacteria bacterium]|jgi:hypothetical protein|nr:hypothetical protein [Acidobacteriota bacterium]